MIQMRSIPVISKKVNLNKLYIKRNNNINH